MEPPIIKRYPGSKFWFVKKYMDLVNRYILANKIINVVDVFGGSGVLIINITPKVTRVYNDLDYRLYCVFDCLIDENLRNQLIKMFAYSFPHQTKFKEFLNIKKNDSKLYVAFKTLYVFVNSFSARQNTNTYTPVSKKNVRNSFEGFKRRLELFAQNAWNNFFVYNLPYDQILKRFGGPQTLFLLDPPYLEVYQDLKLYPHNSFTIEDHKRMLNIINETGSKYILFEISESLSELYGPEAVRVQLRTVTNNVNSQKRKIRTERIWSNMPDLFSGVTTKKDVPILRYLNQTD